MKAENSVDRYRVGKWLHVESESHVLQRAFTRFSKLIEEERYADGITPSRRLRKSAVAFLQSEQSFLLLKERASQ